MEGRWKNTNIPLDENFQNAPYDVNKKHTSPHGLDEDSIHFSWNCIQTKLYDERLHNTTMYGQYNRTCGCKIITTCNSTDSWKKSAIDPMTKTRTLNPYIETVFRELLLKITLWIQDPNGLYIETWAKQSVFTTKLKDAWTIEDGCPSCNMTRILWYNMIKFNITFLININHLCCSQG